MSEVHNEIKVDFEQALQLLRRAWVAVDFCDWQGELSKEIKRFLEKQKTVSDEYYEWLDEQDGMR